MNVLSRNYSKLFFLVLVAGLATGALMAKRNMQVDLGTWGGRKLVLTTQSSTPTGPQIIAATSPSGAQSAPTTTQGALVPGAATVPAGTAAGAAFLGGRGTSGTVESINGNTLTVKAQDGTTIKATVAATTTYTTNVAVTAADIKTGDDVTVIGQAAASGGVITATQVTVGSGLAAAALGGAGRPAIVAGQGGTGGVGRTGGAAVQAGSVTFVTGTVQKVEGNTLTVTGQDGTTSTVTLTADTRLTKVTAGSLSDVKPGAQVTIIGQAGADGAIAALSVQIGSTR